jgi:hypothetical protein
VYAVGIFSASELQGKIFPNVFPDYDMAVDCVIYQIKEDFGLEVDSLEPDNIGGQHHIAIEDTIYVIGKLFNFNPRGL